MPSQQAQILEHVIEIKEDMAGVRQHLKTLNGTVKDHTDAIEKNRETLTAVKGKLYKVGTLAFVIWIVISAAIKIPDFLKFIGLS